MNNDVCELSVKQLACRNAERIQYWREGGANWRTIAVILESEKIWKKERHGEVPPYKLQKAWVSNKAEALKISQQLIHRLQKGK